MAEVREHANKLLFQELVDDSVLEVEGNLLVNVGAVEGGPFGVVAHDLVTHCVGCHAVDYVCRISVPVLEPSFFS